MKLYEIPKGSKILLTVVEPKKGGSKQMCTFRHCDGMYSLIITPHGDAVHLGRNTEVVLVGDHYEVAPNV